MGKGSARTLQHWLDKGYTGEEAEKMRMSRIPGTIEYFHIFKKMSLSEAKKAKEEYQSKRVNTLENMIRKYGDVEGEIRWQEYKDKQAYTNSFEYKKEKYELFRNKFIYKTHDHPPICICIRHGKNNMSFI